jgi:Iap family predicted aminopeptidase
MTKEQVAATEAMENMDALGLAPPAVWATHANKSLLSRLVYIAKLLNISITGVNVERVGASTDSEEFAERKIPSITIHSLTQRTWDARIIHSSSDTLSAIRPDDYYRTYRLLAAYIAYLDQN